MRTGIQYLHLSRINVHGGLRHSDFQQCRIGKKSGWGSPSGESTSEGRGGKLAKFPGNPARSIDLYQNR